MAPHELVLGFMGPEPVHKSNARALIDDLVQAYLKVNKGANVRFIVAIEPHFSETLDDLADWCLTKDWYLELVGHGPALNDEKLSAYKGHAAFRIVKPESSVARTLVSVLATHSEPRLILISDPNDDDEAYTAVEAATERNIVRRSLLKGLDHVRLIDPDEPEGEVADMDAEGQYDIETEADDEPESPEGPADEELHDIDEEIEDGEDEEIGELPDEPDPPDEPEPNDEEQKPVTLAVAADLPSDEVDEPVAAEQPVEEPEKEPALQKERQKEELPIVAVAADTKRYTEGQLARLSKERLYEVAASYGVFPGRGIKVNTMIQRVVAAQNGGAGPKKSAQASSVKTAQVAKQSAKQPAKQQATKDKRDRSTAAITVPASASVSTNGAGPQASRADVAKLLKAAEAVIAAAQKLL